MDSSEAYYEVPHWMHLSFISYDSDDEHKSEGEKKGDAGVTNLSQLWLETFEVTGNGLLRRRKDSQYPHETNSPTTNVRSPSTFSALGNVAATPRPTQERQLISGRNFRDILEACRPRLSGIDMPSPLVSILKLNEQVKCKEKGDVELLTDQTETTGHHQLQRPLREWGAVDFDMGTKSLLRSRRGESPGHHRRFSLSERSEESQSDNGSVSSSFASHVSSMFGMSYDRILWGQVDSPSSPGRLLQMQRSPSLEFDTKDLAVSGGSRDTSHHDGSFSLSPRPESKFGSIKSSSGRDDECGTADEKSGENAESHAQRLRRIMEMRDASLFATTQPLRQDSASELSHLKELSSDETDQLGTTPKTGLLSSQQRRGRESESGGLGAALSQYSSSGDLNPIQVARLPRLASGSRLSSHTNLSQFQLERARAASPMFPMLANQSLDGGLGRSPMFLQPMNSVHGPSLEPPDIKRDSPFQGIVHRRQTLEQKEQSSRDGQSPTTLGTLSPQDTSHMFQPLVRYQFVIDECDSCSLTKYLLRILLYRVRRCMERVTFLVPFQRWAFRAVHLALAS